MSCHSGKEWLPKALPPYLGEFGNIILTKSFTKFEVSRHVCVFVFFKSVLICSMCKTALVWILFDQNAAPWMLQTAHILGL